MFFPVFVVVLTLLLNVLSYNPEEYKCSICMHTVENGFPSQVDRTFSTACRDAFSEDACDTFFGTMLDKLPVINKEDGAARYCYKAMICPHENVWQPLGATNNVDIRVSKAMGYKSYGKLRISAIANTTIGSTVFQYSSPFKYRWTDKYLSSGIVEVTPGVKTNIKITPSLDINVYLPKTTEGVRGLIIGDPCFQSKWIRCLYQDKFEMFNHSVELLNAMSAHTDFHYWHILGDNFYDQDGQSTSQWFQALSLNTKSKFFATAPGNHDFWINSSPGLWVPKDQLGYGFVQFYGQDVMASKLSSYAPYDLSVDPDADSKRGATTIPPASDFFFYHQLGNTGFIGFSGAHSFESQQTYFDEACQWASSNQDLKTVLLVGHWDAEGYGCTGDSAVPQAYQKLLQLPSCNGIATKLRYFMGHKHCNLIMEPNVGYLIGGQGMSDSDCGGSYGLPIVDTTGNQFRVYYFPVAQVNGYDNYQAILECITANGVSGCYHLAEEWGSYPLMA